MLCTKSTMINPIFTQDLLVKDSKNKRIRTITLSLLLPIGTNFKFINVSGLRLHKWAWLMLIMNKFIHVELKKIQEKPYVCNRVSVWIIKS